MNGVVTETLVKSVGSPVVEVAMHWHEGVCRPGRRTDGVMYGPQLVMGRTNEGRGVKYATWIDAMEPVLLVTGKAKRHEGWVHTFRSLDAGGATWFSWLCGDCRWFGRAPCEAWIGRMQTCPCCDAPRATHHCVMWHAFGKCPDCSELKRAVI